jgi:exodeoxyribonuclease V gamma subunit
MRSVPYRVVVLLGLDDERFPRSGRSDGDDLLAAGEAVGDRDRGAEDRQLLLDAFMAAGDHLIVTYSGHDELTNAAYPPAVPVAELIDLVTDMAGSGAAERIITRHHLQPFNPLNFVPGALIPDQPWSFDPMQHRGAGAVREGPTGAAAPAIAIPGDDAGTGTELRLDDLVVFLQHPAKAFLRGRLGVTIPELDDRADDTLPTELAPLEKWSVTDRILAGLAGGTEIDSLIARERAADAVPAGELADPDLEAAVETAEHLWTTATRRGYDPGAVETVSGTVDVAGTTIDGSVLAAPEHARLDTVTPSRLKGKQRIAAYIRLVFLSALDPSRPWTATIVGKNDYGSSLAVVTMGPVGVTESERARIARERLEDLLRLYREGMAAPIPLFCETSYTWATANDRQRTEKASGKWMPGWYNYDPERDQPAHRLLFPTLDTFEAVLETDFAALAADLWRPILQITDEARA